MLLITGIIFTMIIITYDQQENEVRMHTKPLMQSLLKI